jgi:tetratricopeptide (TPR) repeat protein
VLRKLQRYAEAEQSYNSVLRLRPIFPTAHEAVADCHEAAADFDRAIAAHRSAIRVHNEELELRASPWGVGCVVRGSGVRGRC